MNWIKYPDASAVQNAIAADEPLLVLISFDGETVIISQIDEAVEHHILLRKVGIRDTEIDHYFRLVLDREGADWTFICPPDYRNIQNKERRIAAFYKDGFSIISDVLHQMGYLVGIDIPRRYRRHLNYLADSEAD